MFAEKRAVLFVAENVDISFMQYHLLFYGMETGHVIENAKKGNCPRGTCRKTDKLEMILQKMCKMEGCELFWLIQIYTLLELHIGYLLLFVLYIPTSHRKL